MFFGKKVIFDLVKECEAIDEILRAQTLCFTGHRSQKLPWGFNEEDKRCKDMRKTAKEK